MSQIHTKFTAKINKQIDKLNKKQQIQKQKQPKQTFFFSLKARNTFATSLTPWELYHPIGQNEYSIIY